METKKYKDKCDECGRFDVLKGMDGKCLCSNCVNKKQQTSQKKQLSIYDKEVNNGKRLQ